MTAARAGLGGRDLLLVLVICVAWALNFLTSAWALAEIPPFLFTAITGDSSSHGVTCATGCFCTST